MFESFLKGRKMLALVSVIINSIALIIQLQKNRTLIGLSTNTMHTNLKQSKINNID